ncbi:MAG: pyridoxamine 5'-phosphate oxidase family protein [Cystobacter sp.]
MSPASPWHAGELALQRREGVSERLEQVGWRVIRDHLLDQHREFFAQLPFAVLGAVEENGDVWATLRAGLPGFLHSPDPSRLSVALARDETDPAERGMDEGQAIALLGIDLRTRRRNRLNGILHRADSQSFEISVKHSFGNCPRYIQQRTVGFTRAPGAPAGVHPEHLDALDARARELIGHADTFFIASYVNLEQGERQVDVSHRGGKAGFIRLDDDGGLTIPDFAGNQFFNTLGNLLVNPRAGLVFTDFTTGELLQLTGDVQLLFDSPELAAFPGAERLWRFLPRRVIRRVNALPLRWRGEHDAQDMGANTRSTPQ